MKSRKKTSLFMNLNFRPRNVFIVFNCWSLILVRGSLPSRITMFLLPRMNFLPRSSMFGSDLCQSCVMLPPALIAGARLLTKLHRNVLIAENVLSASHFNVWQ